MLVPLPCPFCGAAPQTGPVEPMLEGNCIGYVFCFNRKCPTYDEIRRRGVTVEDGERVNDERGSDAYKQIAIRRWNQRRG